MSTGYALPEGAVNQQGIVRGVLPSGVLLFSPYRIRTGATDPKERYGPAWPRASTGSGTAHSSDFATALKVLFRAAKAGRKLSGVTDIREWLSTHRGFDPSGDGRPSPQEISDAFYFYDEELLALYAALNGEDAGARGLRGFSPENPILSTNPTLPHGLQSYETPAGTVWILNSANAPGSEFEEPVVTPFDSGNANKTLDQRARQWMPRVRFELPGIAQWFKDANAGRDLADIYEDFIAWKVGQMAKAEPAAA